MRDGYKIIDMDTHVNPAHEVLEKYMEPSFRPRQPEFKPYLRVREISGVTSSGISFGAIPFDRFPGTAPSEDDVKAVAGGRSALEGRAGNTHRHPTQPAVQEENSVGRLHDMDLEGRDIDYIIPGTWATTVTGIEDVTLAEGMYAAYHNYMQEYTSADPNRLKSAIQVPGADPEWAISEIKKWSNAPWAVAVWVHLKEGLPIDDPTLYPIWDVVNDLDLPYIHHSFFFEPPYFPGYRDIWGNTVVARSAAHPWGAARLFSYVILSGMLDKYPNLRFGAMEVGHGWLPNWLIRLGFNKSYVSGVTPDLKYTPIEYAQMGRVACGCEPFEGPAMTKAVIEILGEDCLMHQSDYPHGQAWFPETAKEVMEWDIWGELGKDALKKHMYDNAANFLRLS